MDNPVSVKMPESVHLKGKRAAIHEEFTFSQYVVRLILDDLRKKQEIAISLNSIFDEETADSKEFPVLRSITSEN